MTQPYIKKGTRFRSPIADGNPLWEVLGPRGQDVYEAVVLNEPLEINGTMYDSDFVGTVDVFSGERIRRILEFAAKWESLSKKGSDYYESLSIGDVVHYHNAFGNYVRCEVVMGYDDESGSTQKMLKPVALVGNWKGHDLPKRMRDGSVYEPYYTKKVREAEPFRPHASNLYESPEFSDRHGFDPRTLDPISLEVPGVTPQEAEHYAKVRFLDRVAELAQEEGSHDDPDATIAELIEMLNDFEPWRGYEP